MGTGIFFLPALGAGKAGPASIISWILLSIISIYIGMCFAELSSMFPKAGGIYEFCKQAYGKFPSFLIGWTTIITGNITIAMLVVGAIQYIFPADFPLITIPLSLLFVFIFNYIAFKGLKTSAFMLVTFAFITLTTLFLLIIPGLFKFNIGLLQPFFTHSTSSIFITMFFIAETFFGWETATFLAEETKDGQRVMPKALILGTIIIAIISLLTVVTSLGSISWQKFSLSAAPLADLGVLHFGGGGANILTILVYLAIIGSVAGWIVSAPRLLLAMARDGLFLKQLAVIHPKNHTPHKAILFQTVLTTILVFVGAGSYETLLNLLVPIVLLLYIAVLGSLVVMRYTKKDVKRYYTVPGGKWIPYLIMLIMIALIAGWWSVQANAFGLALLGGSFILLGIPVYFLLELYYNPKAIRRTHNIMAHMNWWFERINLPRKRQDEVIKLISPLKGKVIYEYGSDVGTLTLELAKRAKKVYATDFSEKSLIIMEKRLAQRGHTNVLKVHDPKHTSRVHPSIPKVDVIVSVAKFGYVKNPAHMIKQFAKTLKKRRKVLLLRI